VRASSGSIGVVAVHPPRAAPSLSSRSCARPPPRREANPAPVATAAGYDSFPLARTRAPSPRSDGDANPAPVADNMTSRVRVASGGAPSQVRLRAQGDERAALPRQEAAERLLLRVPGVDRYRSHLSLLTSPLHDTSRRRSAVTRSRARRSMRHSRLLAPLTDDAICRHARSDSVLFRRLSQAASTRRRRSRARATAR
jgi:hypothetical protein